MEKLISAIDYPDWLQEKEPNDIYKRLYHRKHVNFIKKELNISMFVPAKKVNGVWVFLEEPKGVKCCGGIQNDCDCRGDLQYDPEEIYEYQKALENVLFEGFEVKGKRLWHNDKLFMISENFEESLSGKTIEWLLRGYNPDFYLTESAKQKLES